MAREAHNGVGIGSGERVEDVGEDGDRGLMDTVVGVGVV